MGKILGDAQPGVFVLGLAAIGAGFFLTAPDGWVEWSAVGLFVAGGALAGRHWGWWRDLSP